VRIAVHIPVALVLTLGLGHAQAQTPAAPKGPWFGLTLPGGTRAPAVLVGTRPPRPVAVPPGDASAPEFDAAAIKADVQTIVQFAVDSRARKEVGNGQMWGRISGFPSSDTTVAWAADQFRQAGIKDVRLQPIAQDARASLWLPLTWRVTLLTDPAFGPGPEDLVLESALPVGPSQIAGGSLTAPLIYVGTASAAVLSHLDVKGKIAVKRGAVGVFNLVRLPGNELSRDFSDCGNPCLNIGGRDGWFPESLLDRATQAGMPNAVRVRVDLTTQTFRGLKAVNAVAVIPGRSPDTVVLNAHADAWFDGAGDNADGLAVLVALARHYGKAATPPERTLVLVASAGHHTPGINGPRRPIRAKRRSRWASPTTRRSCRRSSIAGPPATA